MNREHSEPRLSTPVTSGRKGVVASPTEEQHQQHHLKGLIHCASRETAFVVKTSREKRPSAVTSRSLSSGSSISESNSLLSTSGTDSSSMAATDVPSRASDAEEEDDEKSSGHTVVTKREEVDTVFQLAGGQDDSVAPASTHEVSGHGVLWLSESAKADAHVPLHPLH